MGIVLVFSIFLGGSGLGLLLNPKLVVDAFDDIKSHPGMSLVGSLFAIFLGALVIGLHSVWVFAWPVALTIFGYALFSFALIRFVFMDCWIAIVEPYINLRTIRFVGLLLLLLGLYLGFNLFGLDWLSVLK